MTWAEYLRSVRTLTQEEVDHRAFVRAMADPTPADRAEAHGWYIERPEP